MVVIGKKIECPFERMLHHGFPSTLDENYHVLNDKFNELVSKHRSSTKVDGWYELNCNGVRYWESPDLLTELHALLDRHGIPTTL